MRVIRFFSYLRFIQISKRFLGITVPFLILVGMISPSSGASNPEFDGSVPSYSWSKSTFGNVTYWDQDPPNILFLIDTSGSMVEDPRSTRANPILTYGDGSLPWNNNYYWGTDTDNRNNDPDIASNYHPLLTRRPDGRLVPNDSRLYILRNVMYRLFTERTELLKGINVGIATYAQEKIDDGVFTGRGQHWYWYNSGENFAKYDNNYDNNMWWYWPDWWPDDIQKLRWKGGNTSVSAKKGMRERIPLNAAVSPSTEEVQEELVQLFDGTETSTNEELRADGATPLAASIYGNTDLPLSAYKFFINKSGAYDGICQANWLVVMTDGDDSFNESVSGAVQSLYNGTKSLRDKKGNTLQYPVRTMVIGFVTSKDADGKYTSLANKLNDAADIGFDGVDNDKPAHAYYADNFDELFAAFEDILVTIKEMSGRKSPPRLRAGLPGLKGDVYVPEMVFWETKLWEGKLHKFILDNDGSMGDTAEWESSFPAGNSRVVLTANWYGTGGGYGGTNLVSFKDLNWESLAEELGIRYALSGNSMLAADDPNIETQTKCFIRWYRGEDPSCANWEQRKSPMADMDRSGIAIVSIPQGPWGDGKYLKFKRDHEKRPERLYIQSSEGTLHSFNTETGREEWAFIPPQALRWARIAGLKAVQVTEQDSPSFWKWNWYGNDPAKADEALPREILGGPLVAEDVLVNSSAGEKYATVLLGSMGYGGYGLYALDITDVAKPRFLWAIENAAAVEPKVRQVNPFLPADTSPGTEQTYPIQSLLHWEGKASDTIPSATFRTCTTQNGIFRKNNKQYRRSNEVACGESYFTSRHMDGYKDLAFVLGNPFIGRTFLKAGNDEDSLEFLGFTGAGVRANLTSGSDSLGCAIYAFSMKDGSLHAAWGKDVADFYSFADSYLGVEFSDMGMVYAPLSVKLTAQRTMEHFFVPDSNGYIHQVVFSEEGESLAQDEWKHQTPAKLLSGEKPLVIPHKMPVGKIGEARWIFAGTKNVDTPSGQLENPRHFILGIKVSAYCDETPCGSGCTGAGEPITMANLKVLDATISEDRVYIDNTLCGYEEGDGDDDFWGWQIPLLEADAESPQGEYVSAAPSLSNLFGRLLVATFEPYKETLGSGNDPCAEPEQNGMGRLYLLDAVNGASDWPGEVPEGRKYLELEGVHMTGMGIYDTFVEIDGKIQPVTRIVITFLATEDAQKALQEGGELYETLEEAGVSGLNTTTDGMLSGAIALPEERAEKFFGGDGTMEPTPTVIPIFWKNN